MNVFGALWRRSQGRRVPVACALVAGLAGLLAALASQAGWFPLSALVKIATNDPISRLVVQHDPGFVFVTPAEHYDGLYYYAIAVDPLATGEAHALIDLAPYRYGHPLHGWLAGLLSLGQPVLVPVALFVLGLAGMCLAGWAASRLAHELGASPWVGLVVAASPGLLFAITADTTETVGAGLVLTALLAWHRRRWTLAGVLIVLCCLDKEQYICVPVGLAVLEVVRMWRRRGRSGTPPVGGWLALGAGPAVLGVWYGYVQIRFGAWPFVYEDGNLGAPIVGWLKTFQYARYLSASGDGNASQIGSITAVVLICYVVLIGSATAIALRQLRRPGSRTVVAVPMLLMALITACQGWRTLLYPHEIFRTPAVVTLLSTLVLLIATFPAPVPPGSREWLSRSHDRDALGAGGVREPVVVGDHAGQVIAEFERGRDVERVQGSQDSRIETARRLESGRGEHDECDRIEHEPGADHTVRRDAPDYSHQLRAGEVGRRQGRPSGVNP